jgi:hypothetical protein
MDKKLQLLAYLYGEAEDAAPLSELLRDSDLAAEYQAMSEAKFWLDHTLTERPDPEVVARIKAATAAPPPAPGFADRAPAPRRSFRLSRWGVAASTVATLTLVGLFFLDRTPTAPSPTVLAEEQARQEVDGNPLAARSTAPESEASHDEEKIALADSGVRVAPSADVSASPTLASIPSADPAWEDSDALIQYRGRIEQLMEQSRDLNWDEMVVPLEALPGAAAPTVPPAGLRLNEASSPRPPNR